MKVLTMTMSKNSRQSSAENEASLFIRRGGIGQEKQSGKTQEHFLCTLLTFQEKRFNLSFSFAE